MNNIKFPQNDFLKILRVILKISLYCFCVMLEGIADSNSKSSYESGEAYGLLHEGKIGIAEFLERTED